MSLYRSNLGPRLVPSIARNDRTIISRLMSVLLSHWPQRVRGSPPLPSYLRRDIGLEPLEPSRKYWDHQ
mgnify:CR=1 FL=1